MNKLLITPCMIKREFMVLSSLTQENDLEVAMFGSVANQFGIRLVVNGLPSALGARIVFDFDESELSLSLDDFTDRIIKPSFEDLAHMAGEG